MQHRETASEINDAAAEWAARADRGLATDERDELDQWLEGDTRRLGAFVRAQAAWIHAERAVALGRIPEPTDAPPAAALEEVSPPPWRLNRRLVLGGGGALAASAAAAFLFGSNGHRSLESGVGEIRDIALAGGARLVLDTDSRVDVADASGDRALELVRGKLFLDVPDMRGPSLTVRAGSLLLRTAGGAFGLEGLEGSPLIALVTRGVLMVSQSQGLFGGRRTLAVGTGHVLELPSGEPLTPHAVRPVSPDRRERLLSWREGMLSFGGEPLSDAVRAFDRYGATRIVVADPDLGRQKVVGLFRATDPRGFALAVAASFGGIVTTQGDVVRISARASTSA